MTNQGKADPRECPIAGTLNEPSGKDNEVWKLLGVHNCPGCLTKKGQEPACLASAEAQ